MRLCIHCNQKPARDKRRLCRTCETNKYMEQRYYELKELFLSDNSSEYILMRDFIDYLDNAYGDQKREIAYRTRYVWEAIQQGNIKMKTKWTISDVSIIEEFRQNLSIQKKTAIYHFLQYLIDRYNLTEDQDELRILTCINNIAIDYQGIVRKYLEFLKIKRNLKHWTRYQLAFALKYFFDFIVEKYSLNDIRQIDKQVIVEYLRFLKTKNAQKYIYTRFSELKSFFKWSKKYKYTFLNPCDDIDVAHHFQLSNPITEEEQKSVIKKWLDPDCDPRAALIGTLTLIYGFSVEELQYLTVDDFQNDMIIMKSRPSNIILASPLIPMVERYFKWRDLACMGTDVKYVVISRESYKSKKPIHKKSIHRILSDYGLSPRRLRATRLLELAATGNIKLLEGIGLKFDSTRPYLRAATPVLSMGHSWSLEKGR